MLLHADTEANKIVDIKALSKLLEGYYCKGMDHSCRSWSTHAAFVAQCDTRLGAGGKYTRSCYKRGVQTCKDASGKEKLA